MKAILFALTMFAATAAQAMVHLPGTFVANKCGLHEYNIAEGRNVQAICVGAIVGDEAGSQSIVFHLNDETQRRFKVADTASLLIGMDSGNIQSKFFLVDIDNGEHLTLNVIQNPQGDILSVSGMLEGHPFMVPQFETVLTIQSADPLSAQ